MAVLMVNSGRHAICPVNGTRIILINLFFNQRYHTPHSIKSGKQGWKAAFAFDSR